MGRLLPGLKAATTRAPSDIEGYKPIGITVDPGAMSQDYKATWRRWREQRTRERVAKELEELRARKSPESH